MTRRVLLSALGAALMGSPARAADEAPSPEVRVTVDRKKIIAESRLEIGVTHTQYSLDTYGEPGAVVRGKKLLVDAGCRLQNVHILGWGANNPNPALGVYDWTDLDRRMAMMRSMPGTVPVITLCGCPDWMKGGEPGKTDWTKLGAAPLPEHYQDFAELAATIARRFPDVRHFQVWNEMKGLWNARENHWDYVGYTDLYNRVYDALKKVNPGNQVGGPYLVIEGTGGGKSPESGAANPPVSQKDRTVIEYWLKNKHGADFITLDRSLTSYHDKNEYTLAERMELPHWFGYVTEQVRKYPGAEKLPFWWAEFYPSRLEDTKNVQAVLHALSYRSALLSGTAVILIWQPMDFGEVGNALFTDARKPDGGNPLPLYHVVRDFHEHFAPGIKICAATSSDPKTVEVISSLDALLLINKTAQAVTVRGWAGTKQERAVTLAPYTVQVEKYRQ